MRYYPPRGDYYIAERFLIKSEVMEDEDHMHGTTDSKKRTIHRLKIASGHLNKVISMVEEDSYCIDVLLQSRAVEKALEETDALILENHLNTCVIENIKKGDAKQSIDEIMNIFRKKNKQRD